MQPLYSRSFRSSTFVAIVLLTGCLAESQVGYRDTSALQWNAKERIKVPLVIDPNGLPTVKVQIGGKEVMALVDSGSSVAFMNPGLVPDSVSYISSNDGQKIAKDIVVNLGPLALKLGHTAIRELPNDIQLILGKQLFTQAIVEMDFANGSFTIIHPRAFVLPSTAPLALQSRRTVPVIPVTLTAGRRTICAVVDTGFNLGIALPEHIIAELALDELPNSRAVGERLRGSFEPKVLVPLHVEVGGVSYHDVSAASFPGNDHCEALLGMAVLSRHRLIFDLANDRLWALPKD